ncbi:hypothetical protein N500_0124 [Wolbachia pipientis wUni]|nr:hypothetical protein N500_0124 [Wolbachia pipientis wUni]
MDKCSGNIKNKSNHLHSPVACIRWSEIRIKFYMLEKQKT